MSTLAVLFFLALPVTQLPDSPHSNSKPVQRPSASKLTDGGVCYTLRSYFFSRTDNEAPRLVGETTCTPDYKLQQRNVVKKPIVRLVPAQY